MVSPENAVPTHEQIEVQALCHNMYPFKVTPEYIADIDRDILIDVCSKIANYSGADPVIVVEFI